MGDKYVIITNNPLVKKTYEHEHHVDYETLSLEDTLRKVRDRVYEGHRLLSHPLSGSVKPGETPYKSVMITEEKGRLDAYSVGLIENAIQTCSKFQNRADEYTPEVYKDFQLVDCTLITSAILSADNW